MMKELPQEVRDELLILAKQCWCFKNLQYLKTKIKVVKIIYLEKEEELFKKLKRWDIMSILDKEPSLIKEQFLNKEKMLIINDLYSQAKESL